MGSAVSSTKKQKERHSSPQGARRASSGSRRSSGKKKEKEKDDGEFTEMMMVPVPERTSPKRRTSPRNSPRARERDRAVSPRTRPARRLRSNHNSIRSASSARRPSSDDGACTQCLRSAPAELSSPTSPTSPTCGSNPAVSPKPPSPAPPSGSPTVIPALSRPSSVASSALGEIQVGPGRLTYLPYEPSISSARTDATPSVFGMGDDDRQWIATPLHRRMPYQDDTASTCSGASALSNLSNVMPSTPKTPRPKHMRVVEAVRQNSTDLSSIATSQVSMGNVLGARAHMRLTCQPYAPSVATTVFEDGDRSPTSGPSHVSKLFDTYDDESASRADTFADRGMYDLFGSLPSRSDAHLSPNLLGGREEDRQTLASPSRTPARTQSIVPGMDDSEGENVASIITGVACEPHPPSPVGSLASSLVPQDSQSITGRDADAAGGVPVPGPSKQIKHMWRRNRAKSSLSRGSVGEGLAL